MILYGRYRSPFTRRVAISMRLLGIPYEHRAVTTWTHLSDVRKVNPVGRVPALVLDDGECLFDSGAILDYLDQLAGPDRALVPALEPSRHRVLRIVACAMGGLEKVVAALYEHTMHPAEKVHEPWIKHNEAQACSAFAWLDKIETSPWLARDGLTQADVTTVVTWDFTNIVAPWLLANNAYPNLNALRERCNELPAFGDTLPLASVDQANPKLPEAASNT